MSTEVIYSDGSISSFYPTHQTHDGPTALMRLRLLMAKGALATYIDSGGAFQLTRNGAQLAIKNVVEPITGKTYKRSMKGKREALADCLDLIADIEAGIVVFEVFDDLDTNS